MYLDNDLDHQVMISLDRFFCLMKATEVAI